jgi:hypothetical protein
VSVRDFYPPLPILSSHAHIQANRPQAVDGVLRIPFLSMKHALPLSTFAFLAVSLWADYKPNPAAITTSEVGKIIRAGDYTLTEFSKLEANSVKAATETERLTARMLLVETWLQAQSPFTLKEVRGKLRVLIADAPDSWQAQVARLQLMRTFDIHTEANEMIKEAEEALKSTNFDLLNNPQDPFLISYLEVLDFGTKDMRDVFIYFRGAAYATAINVEKVKADFNLLPEGELKTQLGYQIRDLEAITPDQRTRRSRVLIEAVKSAERQDAERRAIK